ncbi:pentatricopeptide repeat-containing protein [Tripterygium wilfordii]|uniref:Pentatricopeptide repeat-containing protein n=1 Tax=Tripterygium wilfordii TaxID=458696 RepID=A0A7J7D7J1_TRIWF|nr:pentatricopeptide repeat-containing protein [Tripterygium wilfordii]
MNSKLLTLIRFSRCYSTSRRSKEALYSKISPLGNPSTSLVPELDSWVSDGNKVRVSELQRIIRDLRKRKRFTQALQVSEWMNKNGICSFSPTEHAVQLNLIGRVHGPLGNPATSLGPELDSWVSDGKEVRVAELQRIIRDLRKRKRFTQALQVSEWMNKNGICAFSPTEHAVQLNLIGRVHGYLSAENYFYNLRDEEKTDKTYGALLHCYVQQKQIDKALSHVQKMREMGIIDNTNLTAVGDKKVYLEHSKAT